ncbi:thioester reductase domain-containing protein [Crocosphaera sp. Alani8]|uniref:thioester reductase domain-containing protein n=1 Tax=Crocosphaera sp. Alani8 TaxID=3038952 RepID=UPI00313E70D6
MTNTPVYLKPNVIVEPLINQWYAWSYLVSPATAAMYVTKSHLEMMESFVVAPQVHRSALKNPAMIGGPFINYDESRVGGIKQLLARTKTEQARLINLAKSIDKLEQILNQEGTGYSLEPLYKKVPDPLKGYVELVYDSYNNPSIRFIERLLYHSPYYNPQNQSIALSLENPDRRSFVLSTPRLPSVQNLHINIPFKAKKLDRLLTMRHTARSYAEIKDILAIKSHQEALFSSFFTEEVPRTTPKYEGEGVRVRYFGHACVLVEAAGVSILCDPLISNENPTGIPRYSYGDLPPHIDYALITHNHQDHVMLETLLQIRHKIGTVVVPKSNKGLLVDPSLRLALEYIGFTNVREIDELDNIHIPGGKIIGLPFLGEHGDLNIAAKTAYLIQLKERSILCAADSNNIEPKLYDHLYDLFGNLDVLFIGMECDGAPYTWAYKPLLSVTSARKMAETRRLDGSNAEKAIKLVQRFAPEQVYVYAMGQEPWLKYITSLNYTEESRPIIESNQLVKYCCNHNIISKRLLGREEMFLEEGIRGSSLRSNHLLVRDQNSDSRGDTEMGSTKEKSINEFLGELEALDIKLRLDGDRLRCNAPKGVLTPAIQGELKARKPEIIAFLTPAKTQANLKAEAVLDPSIIPPNPYKIASEPTKIFLTGATGFLGTALLYDLLKQTSATFYCLVREETPEGAREKLCNRLKLHYAWDDSFTPRIIPLIGDLSKPLLGLSQEQFERIGKESEVIYHNGAWVNHTYPYSRLKSTNVFGTQEVLRLACEGRTKPVHFISTISVFNPTDLSEKRVIKESDELDPEELPLGGYAQSKWVAEKLVTIAQERGLPTSIYRVGPISGHSKTGLFNPHDFLYKLIIGYVHLGSAPEGKMLLDILPVDYVSQAIISLSKQSETLGKAFHLIHTNPVSSDLLFEQLEAMGYGIERISYEQWYNKLLGVAKSSPNHPLYPLVPLFSAARSDDASTKSFNLKFDCYNAIEGLNNSTVSCPAIDRNLLKTYISYLLENGFLSPLNNN